MKRTLQSMLEVAGCWLQRGGKIVSSLASSLCPWSIYTTRGRAEAQQLYIYVLYPPSNKYLIRNLIISYF